MADPRIVAKKDGKAFRTHKVEVEDGYVVASDYRLVLCERWEISATGLLKIFELSPSDPQSTLSHFIGRWDERKSRLKVYAVDATDTVDKSVRFAEHHPRALPDHRFDVEIRLPEGALIFKANVGFGLGGDVRVEGDSLTLTGYAPKIVIVRRAVPDNAFAGADASQE
jgi:hypothetical protein